MLKLEVSRYNLAGKLLETSYGEPYPNYETLKLWKESEDQLYGPGTPSAEWNKFYLVHRVVEV